MPYGMVPIGPRIWGKAIPVQAVKRAVVNALEMGAEGVKADFDVVTATWSDSTKPKIATVKPGEYERLVTAEGEVFGYVNFGTSAHDITPRSRRFLRFRSGYRPKTRPNGRIASYQGGRSGAVVFARRVRHPGTSGRHFDKIIKRKWDKQFPIQLRRAVNAAIRSKRP